MRAPRRRPAPIEGFPSRGTIIDRGKKPVDATGWIWKLNHLSNVSIDFRKLGIGSAGLLLPVVKYIGELVATSSVDNVRGTFDALRFMQRSEHFGECDADGGSLDLRLISELRLVEGFAEWRLHYVRAWYRWCAERDLPQFSRAVAERMEEIRIPGNPKGVAVRTHDPDHGALDRIETMALVGKLKQVGPEVLTLFEQVLIWLALAFGCNPLAFQLLREEDYELVAEEGTGRVHHILRIPRVKKRRPLFRGAHHPKRPDHVIGSLVAALIEENVAYRREHGWPEGCAFPLFRRAAPRAEQLGGPMHEFAMHRDDLTAVLKAAVAKLDVVSHRTGKPINVTVMRFRRTFVTRAVEENVAPNEVAVMVDHSDLQNLKVYYETRSSIVDRLDAAMAVKLGPIADAFMGKIVSDPSETENGTDPAKRIPWFRRGADGRVRPGAELGVCGAQGACREFAPISCYTCRRFRPWRDGPHREILQQLCDERESRAAAGLDPQIVGVRDATIVAIGQVVAACEGKAE